METNCSCNKASFGAQIRIEESAGVGNLCLESVCVYVCVCTWVVYCTRMWDLARINVCVCLCVCVCAPSVLVPLILWAKIMRILSAAPLRRGALIEWEQSVTDETSDSGPARLHSGRLTHRQHSLWGHLQPACVCANTEGGIGMRCVAVTKREPLGLWRMPWLAWWYKQ